MSEEYIKRLFRELYKALKDAKPSDRDGKARMYAIIITELEKMMAFYEYWIYDSDLREGE